MVCGLLGGVAHHREGTILSSQAHPDIRGWHELCGGVACQDTKYLEVRYKVHKEGVVQKKRVWQV